MERIKIYIIDLPYYRAHISGILKRIDINRASGVRIASGASLKKTVGSTEFYSVQRFLFIYDIKLVAPVLRGYLQF